MDKELYIALQGQIKQYLPELKHVAKWNNQFRRSNGTGHDGKKQAAFDYPCVFLEFNKSNFRQLSLGVQEFDLEVITHLGFKSFETEDLTILDLKERLYWVCQRFQQGSYARLSRVNEVPDYDFDDVEVYKTQYHTYGKDYNRYVFATTPLNSFTGLTINESLVYLSAITQNVSAMFSGATDDNGTNIYNP